MKSFIKGLAAAGCILLLVGCGQQAGKNTEATEINSVSKQTEKPTETETQKPTETETPMVTETETEMKTEAKTETETQATEESQTIAMDGPLVVIDAGHQGPGQDMSGTEPNAPGSSVMKVRLATGTSGTTTGVPEYELNLQISLALETELKERGYQVLMTRTTHDIDIGNVERAEIANQAGADALVRIHANGSEDSSVAGALTMAPSASNPYMGAVYEDCMRLSQNIVDQYCAATGLENLGILAMDDMTGINWSQVPVTIVEMGFMTNPGDDTFMSYSENQELMVEGIANGIDVYFGR